MSSNFPTDTGSRRHIHVGTIKRANWHNHANDNLLGHYSSCILVGPKKNLKQFRSESLYLHRSPTSTLRCSSVVLVGWGKVLSQKKRDYLREKSPPKRFLTATAGKEYVTQADKRY
jgi:hypothetical protein